MAKLAIIGAGPKGAAIVAKAAALQTTGYRHPPPQIDLYDDEAVGAAWRGTIGYTDGEQPLCTLAERDLGFPYDASAWGSPVAEAMLGQFSWQAFSIQASGRTRYRDWIVDGRNPPAHSVFAEYLEHAVSTAIKARVASHIQRRVTSIDFDPVRKQWRVESSDKVSPQTGDYDGVVITGSGRPVPPLPGANGRVFDGQSFWRSVPQMRSLLLSDPDPSIIIIGAGGTAAAIAYWFVRQGLTTLPITIIGREATLFARHHGPFEDRLFSDDVAWKALAPHVKEAFLSRTTAAVVWDYVLRNLRSDNINYESYSARGFAVKGQGPALTPDLLDLELDIPPDSTLTRARGLLAALGGFALGPFVGPLRPPPAKREATVFVDARGFDRWGFVDDLFATSPLRPFFASANQAAIQSDMTFDLCISGQLAGRQVPEGLHVPGLGSIQGPAATNLMGLGWLSDRVLSRYC